MILSSFVYTLFDYQINDQTRNALYTEGTLNASLYAEDCGYLSYYLRKDMPEMSEADAQRAQALQDKLDAQQAAYETGESTLPL